MSLSVFLGPSLLSPRSSPLIFSRVRRCARIMYHVSVSCPPCSFSEERENCVRRREAATLKQCGWLLSAAGRHPLQVGCFPCLGTVHLYLPPTLPPKREERGRGAVAHLPCRAMPCTANKTPYNLKRPDPASQRSKLRPPLPGLSHLASSLQAARAGRWMARRAARPDFRMNSQHLRKGHPTYTGRS